MGDDTNPHKNLFARNPVASDDLSVLKNERSISDSSGIAEFSPNSGSLGDLCYQMKRAIVDTEAGFEKPGEQLERQETASENAKNEQGEDKGKVELNGHQKESKKKKRNDFKKLLERGKSGRTLGKIPEEVGGDNMEGEDEVSTVEFIESPPIPQSMNILPSPSKRKSDEYKAIRSVTPIKSGMQVRDCEVNTLEKLGEKDSMGENSEEKKWAEIFTLCTRCYKFIMIRSYEGHVKYCERQALKEGSSSSGIWSDEQDPMLQIGLMESTNTIAVYGKVVRVLLAEWFAGSSDLFN